jgi:hypothetical protein
MDQSGGRRSGGGSRDNSRNRYYRGHDQTNTREQYDISNQHHRDVFNIQN